MSRPAVALAAAAALAWALVAGVGTGRVALEHVEVAAPALAPVLAGRRLLHVSDLHVRRVGARERRALALARAARPDLILVTGDLVEPRWGAADLDAALAVMRRLAAVAPTVAVLGNNDLPPAARPSRVDTARLVAGLEAAGVLVLRNAAARLSADPRGPAAYVVGVDDNFLRWDDLDRALLGVPAGAPALLLAHSPDIVVDRDVSRFALVLAGHTHGGQIRLPLSGAVYTQTRGNRFVEGLYALPSGGWLHVSGGVGTSLVDLRLFALPSMTVLEVAPPAGRA